MKRITTLLGVISIISGFQVYADSIPTPDIISETALEFASKYPYKEGDIETSFSLYPDVNYTSGIETRNDGVQYECPAVYFDDHAVYVNDFDLKKGEMNIIINDKSSAYSKNCILYNGVTLVPADVFEELGCLKEYDENYYVTKLTKDDVVLEIIPYLIGMRKNQDNGYYVPLNACARYVDNELYIPIRAVAEEFNINVSWDGESYSVILSL